MNKNNFWNGKKVLITGHTGFKGSWLSLWLQYFGAEVVGVSLDPPTMPSLYIDAGVGEGMISLREDIRNGKAIKKIFQQKKPEIVFHLAAQPLVRYSYCEPVETYETNVMGTLHVLEGIRSIDTVRAAVMVTTDKCYQNREWVWGYRENDPMGGHDPYSSSKGAAELLINSYRKSYYSVDKHNKNKASIASVRSGDVIGGGDWAEDRLIPDIVRSFLNCSQVKIRNSHAVRPWQHVLEPLSGYIKLAEILNNSSSEYAEAWNFGPNESDAQPVRWIADQMAVKWGKDACWDIDKSDCHPHEANYLKLDCSKAHIKLGWRPKWDLSQALSQVIEWHKLEKSGISCKEICLSQINKYMES